MTTRLIGAIIMVHGDDSGLVLPQNCTGTDDGNSIEQYKDGVLDKAKEVKEG